jgi:cell division protein ZapB
MLFGLLSLHSLLSGFLTGEGGPPRMGGPRLDELVVITSQLKEENQSLRQRQDNLIAERATLLQKNEQVRARVEAMIGRLKAMEHGS